MYLSFYPPIIKILIIPNIYTDTTPYRITVPASLKMSERAKIKTMDSKIEIIESAAITWGQQNKSKIINRALNLYYGITQENASDMLRKRCCDFLLLEEKCYEYMNNNYIREEELIYCYV